ncbi:Protein transport protein bos1 [Vanrija pseudolonga]|uniref:Protein transport protein BOS1 n=1 Tax=Vanrija pseudolonga TaxID=143232 RepID=A0AAF0Y5V3_9TREE|nr:Protein transport protein bos1 [Vanrija pseudolonga]
MNSLNALGNRQVASLQADLARFEQGEGGPSIQGQITTTLSALSRLVDDYDSMARREMNTAAREKANTRVLKLKTEHKDLKGRFEKAKSEGQQRNRDQLLGSSTAMGAGPNSTATMRRNPNGQGFSESPFGGGTPNLFQPNQREDFALREHSFIQESENNIDQYIAQGRAVLENLIEQRGILKGTRRRLLDAANTLGLSRETIAWVEKRAKQDAWIFFAGATFTIFSFWLIWHYLG